MKTRNPQYKTLPVLKELGKLSVSIGDSLRAAGYKMQDSTMVVSPTAFEDEYTPRDFTRARTAVHKIIETLIEDLADLRYLEEQLEENKAEIDADLMLAAKWNRLLDDEARKIQDTQVLKDERAKDRLQKFREKYPEYFTR